MSCIEDMVCRGDNEAEIAAITASTAQIFPHALNAAIELDLFSIIHNAGNGNPISPSEVASYLPIRGPKEEAVVVLDSILRLLSSYSILTCSVNEDLGRSERRYGLAPPGKYFVRDEAGPSLVKFHDLHYHHAEIQRVFQNLKDAVLGGVGLFERLKGKSMFEDRESNQEFREAFQGAMRSHSTFILGKLLEKYQGFKGLHSIVDVGGCHGATLEMIISKYPSIRGINFDLPEVIQKAPSYQGIEHIGGDMFVEVPHGEAILLKFVLHNWRDKECIQLLKNCCRALPKDKLGKVIVMDNMLPQVPSTDMHSKYTSQMDLTMLVLVGARERTMDQFEFLAKASGFSKYEVVDYVNGIWVMEFIKPT